MKKISFLLMKKLINFFTFCFLISGFTQGIKAQIYYGDLYLSTQAEVDAFNYTEVTGELFIYTTTITNNLNGLSELTSVGGALIIVGNPSVTHVDGLSSLLSVGGSLEIYTTLLTNLDGLSSLLSVGASLNVYNNPSLSDCCGIQDLVNTPGAINGSIFMEGNQTGCETPHDIQNAPCSSDADGDDVDDEEDNCPNNANPSQEDADCDGVGDACDVCPGGNDSVDNNSDNIPDCSQLLNYNDYSPDWKCGNNKIYVCHNDNNPQTICIDANAMLPAHYNHGDLIGPCISCPQNLSQPGNNGFPIAISMSEKAKLTLIDYDAQANSHEDEALFKIIPNPADDHI